jgi:hypothetical protein
MNIIYKITYLPHLNTSYPKYYIGSKLNYKGNYFGSIASRKKLEFTEGVSLKDWWKKQHKHNPNAFLFEVLEDCSMLDKHQLAEKEKEYQLKHNAALSSEFFNQATATGLFVGGKKDNETKTKMSASLKKFYQTPEGLDKRKRLIERNKTSHAITMKEKWKNPSDKMLQCLTRLIAHKPSIETIEKLKKSRLIDIEYKGKIYKGWYNLLKEKGVSKHLYKKYYLNGFEPEVNIGIKHNPQLIKLI